MGVLTSSSTVPPAVTSYFDRKLLRRATPMLHHGRVAQRRPLSMRSGNTMVFRKISALSLALTPLVEGVPPAGKQLSKSDISVTIQQWGDYVTLTDLVQATVEHPILQDANKILGEQAGQTIDALIRDVACAGTSCHFANATSITLRTQISTTTDKVTTALLDRMIRELNQNNARRFTELIQASTKVSTAGIRPAFWGITTPEVLFTLETLSGFKPIEQYASNGPVLEGEAGAYKDVRFLISTQAKNYPGGGTTASGDVKGTGGVADVHTILMFGTDAIGSIPLEGGALKNIIKPLGSGGVADPLNQIATSGWIHTGARKRLEETFMTRAEVAVGNVAP
jgi:N4-gp56 family major capsid protein